MSSNNIVYGTKNATVRRIQAALIDLGYPLPKYGADGQYGAETAGAIHLLFLKRGDFATPDTTFDVLRPIDVQRFFDYALAVDTPLLSNFVDYRMEHAGIKRYGLRDWSDVTGITLHQTACVLGNEVKRWANIGCHVGITRTGKVIWLSDFNALVVHGNGFNAKDVGIEIDGMYAGIEGKKSTFWRPKGSTAQPQQLTPETIRAAKEVIAWIHRTVEGHGGRLKYLHAHRQSSNMRQSDPGSAIWQQIAMPAHRALKLTDGGPNYKLGTGARIPTAWNPEYKGVKY